LTQCIANTQKGKRCENSVVKRSHYCRIHRNRNILAIGGIMLMVLSVLADITGVFSYIGINVPSQYQVNQLFSNNTKFGTWQETGKLNQARYDFGIALLQDCRVLITGGRNTWIDSKPLSSTEIYDPKNHQWSLSSPLNEARYWFGNVVILMNGDVLITGGTRYGGYDDISSTELYNPESQKWEFSGNLNQPRRGATLVLLNDGKVLIAGGRQGRPDVPGFIASAEIYDPITGKWSITGDMNIPRVFAESIRLLDGKVMVFGGEGPWFEYGKTTEIYDPTTGKWTQTGDLNMIHYWPSTLLLPDGKVLVVGGSDGNQNFNTGVEIYDPSTGIWALQNSIQAARGSASIALLDNQTVILAGGVNQGTTSVESLNSTELLNLSTGVWSIGPNLSIASNSMKALWIPNIGLLITGGWKNDPQTEASNSTEIFVPVTFNNQYITECHFK